MRASLPQVLFILEISSVALVLIYLYFAAKRNANAWIFGILASCFSMVLFYKNAYFGSFILNGFYALQGIAGYMHWKWLNKDKQPAFRVGVLVHFVLVLLCPVLATTLLAIFDSIGITDVYFWDLILASGSIIATFLEIRKDTSAWLYWIVCNAGYTVLYFINPMGNEPMYYYTLLMLLLTVFSYLAMRVWIKSSKSVDYTK